MGFDAEELTDEVFKIRRGFDDELGMLLGSERRGVFAGGKEVRMQQWHGGVQLLEEDAVELDEAFTLVEIAEFNSEG